MKKPLLFALTASSLALSAATFATPLLQLQNLDNNDFALTLTNTNASIFRQSVISADNKFVYGISWLGNSIVVLQRDNATGLLTPTQKVVEDPQARTGEHLPSRILLSPDNKYVYVLGLEAGFGVVRSDGKPTTTDRSIAVFARDSATGQLTQIDNNPGDALDLGYEGEGLSDASGIGEALVTSHDGSRVYVATMNSGAITVLKRASNGILTEAQHINLADVVKNLGATYSEPNSIALSTDDKNLYVALHSNTDTKGFIAHFQKDSTGQLIYKDQVDYATVTGLPAPHGIDLSPDGRFLYAYKDQAIFILSVDAAGTLSYSSSYTFSDNGNPPQLYWPNDLLFSNNGRIAYLSDDVTDALLVFGRDLNSGALTYYGAEVSGQEGVINMEGPNSVALTPDNLHAIVSSDYAMTVFDIFSDLSVTATTAGDTVAPGSSVTYSLDIKNAEGATAHRVSIGFTPPAGATVSSATPASADTSCAIAGNAVTCTINELATNAAESVAIVVTESATLGAAVSQASATADEVDSNASNNTASNTVTISTLAPTPNPTPNPTPAPVDNSGGGGGGGGSFNYLLLLLAAAGAFVRRMRSI